MHSLRNRLLGLILAIVTGLALAAIGLGHRLPSAAEQVAQVAGLSVADICGQSPDGTSGDDHACPACLAGFSILPAAAIAPAPTQLVPDFRLALPSGIAVNPQQRSPGHPSRGPPAAQI